MEGGRGGRERWRKGWEEEGGRGGEMDGGK